MNKKTRAILYIAAFVAVVFVMSATANPATAAWADTDWANRRAITIINSHPENYQIQVPSFPDNSIRFWENEAAGQLNYWVQREASENIVWVRRAVPSTGDSTIYMYYNNSGATLAENGASTFTVYENWDDDLTAGWTSNGGTWSHDSANEEYNIVTGGSSSNALKNYGTTLENYIFSVNIRGTTTDEKGILFYGDTFSGDAGDTYVFRMSSTNAQLYRVVGAEWSALNTASISHATNTWYELKVKVRTLVAGVEMFCYIDNVLIYGYQDNHADRHTSGRVGIRYSGTQTGRNDDFIVSSYVSPEPIANIGAAEASTGNIVFTNVQADNYLIDRYTDWDTGNTRTGTTVYVDVEFTTGQMVAAENVKIVFRGDDDVNLDNKNAADNLWVNDNTQRFWVAYYTDNSSLPDASLGAWDLVIDVYDDAGAFGSNTSTTVFYVDDWESDNTIENARGHRIRFYGTASRVSGTGGTVTGLWLVDNSQGTMLQTTANTFDNTYYVGSGGNVAPRIRSDNLDGYGDNVSYLFPNLTPGLANLSVSAALVDRDHDNATYAATLTTRITVTVEDNDGYSEIESSVRIAIRDANNYLIENTNVWATRTLENENRIIFYRDFNPDNNTENCGDFDVLVYAQDNYNGGYTNNWGGKGTALFVVDDLQMTVIISADNSVMGLATSFPLTVTGEILRASAKNITMENANLIDENAGFILRFENENYTVGYTITALPGTDNVFVQVVAVDGALDGENFGYYDVNDNLQFQVYVRLEENYDLFTDVLDSIENHSWHLTFYFPQSTREYDITDNPQTFVLQENMPEKIRLDDEDDGFWRTRIPTNVGVVNFFLPENIDNIYLYEFSLKDLTGQFGEEDNGYLTFFKYYEDNRIDAHEDFWGANDVVVAWLIYGEEYDIQLTTAVQERSTSPIIPADDLTLEIIVGTYELPDPVTMWNGVYYSVFWTAENYIRVSYQDNTGNTNRVTVNIIDENEVTAYTTTYTTNTWMLTYTDADPTTSYIVQLWIDHATFGAENLSYKTALAMILPLPLPQEPVPGLSQMGTIPFGYGAAFAVLITMFVGLMFGARQAGFAVMAIAGILTVIGPIFSVVYIDPLLIVIVGVLGVIEIFVGGLRGESA